MSIYHLLLCGIFLPGIQSTVTVETGFKDYTKYEHGNMNIIITAPHGGFKRPSTQENLDIWPDRANGCIKDGECVWTHDCGVTSSDCRVRIFNDLFTRDIARDIADKIKDITGFRPHVVYNMLSRRKLDANREINEATLNVADAITAYQDYASFINQARWAISGPGFLLDIHGQTHTPARTELGYTCSELKFGVLWTGSESENKQMKARRSGRRADV